MRVFSLLFALACAALRLTPALAFAGSEAGWQQRPHAVLRLTAAALEQAGNPAPWAAVELKLEPGWKIYWRSPGGAGIPTTFDWSGSENLRNAETRWPRPKRARIWNVDTLGYGGQVMFPVALDLHDPAAPTVLHVRVAYGVCREICVRDEAVLTLKVEPGDWSRATEAERIRAALATVPDPGSEAALRVRHAVVEDGRLCVDAESAEPAVAPDLFVEGPAGLRFGPTVATIGDDRRQVRFEVPVQGTTQGTLPLVLTFVDGPRAFERKVTLPFP